VSRAQKRKFYEEGASIRSEEEARVCQRIVRVATRTKNVWYEIVVRDKENNLVLHSNQRRRSWQKIKREREKEGGVISKRKQRMEQGGTREGSRSNRKPRRRIKEKDTFKATSAEKRCQRGRKKTSTSAILRIPLYKSGTSKISLKIGKGERTDTMWRNGVRKKYWGSRRWEE